MGAVFGRRYSIFSLKRSLSNLPPSEIEMSYRGGGGYGRRGRGPNRGGGRGQRGGGGNRGRGRGGSGRGGAEGHGAPPPAGLRGRALGMWYASRSRAHKKARERNEVSTKRCFQFPRVVSESNSCVGIECNYATMCY